MHIWGIARAVPQKVHCFISLLLSLRKVLLGMQPITWFICFICKPLITMKYLRLLIPALLLVVMVSSCEKDPELGATTFTLSVQPTVGNSNVVLGQEYLDQESYRIKPTTLRFYASHITLSSASGDIEIKDIALFDMEDVEAGKPMTMEVEVPAGDYTGISFWVGLDSAQNASNPADFDNDNPLSLAPGTFWTWNTGYRFVMLEGYFDTIQNTPSPVSSTRFFNYHTGTNPLYAKAELGSASIAFTVTEGANYTYSLDLDLNNVFYGPANIDRKLGASTHTTSNYPLAEKFTQNFVSAFKLSAP